MRFRGPRAGALFEIRHALVRRRAAGLRCGLYDDGLPGVEARLDPFDDVHARHGLRGHLEDLPLDDLPDAACVEQGWDGAVSHSDHGEGGAGLGRTHELRLPSSDERLDVDFIVKEPAAQGSVDEDLHLQRWARPGMRGMG